MMADFRIVYLVADLRRVGPTNQTLNIICNSGIPLDDVLVLSLFDEPKDSMCKIFEQRGISCQSLHLKRNNPFVAWVKLRNFFRKNQIGLVHSYGVKPDILLYFVSKFQKVCYVLTQRNIPIEDYPPRMNRMVGILIAKLHTFVFRHSRNVVACSRYLQKVMHEKYRCSHIVAIQNGIDTELFKNFGRDICRKQFGLPLGAFVYISTGLFIERKHNDEIVEAFLAAKFENAYLVMLGDGPLLFEMQRKYAKNEAVLFVGKSTKVAEYLSAADCFISASDSEGLPNAVLEALACGVPVILSDIPQHLEILDELPNVGKTFALHDVNAMSNVMKEFVMSGSKYDNISADLERSSFTMKKMGEKYRKYYDGLLCKC